MDTRNECHFKSIDDLERFWNKEKATLEILDYGVDYIDSNGRDGNDGPLTSDDIKYYILPFLAKHPKITTLSLMFITLDIQGAKSLATTETLATLSLRCFGGDAKVIKALAASPTIENLDVSGCDIDDECAKALAANTTLKILKIRSTFIGNEGIKALAANTTIEKLDFRYNKNIGEAGMAAWNESDPHKRAQNALDADMKPEDVPVPSLLRLCLFKVKNSPQLNTENLTEGLKVALQKARV